MIKKLKSELADWVEIEDVIKIFSIILGIIDGKKLLLKWAVI